MKTHFNLSASEYERTRGGHLGRRRRDVVDQALAGQIGPGRLVLEVGCGPGTLLESLAQTHPDVQFVGLDVDRRMIEHARAQHTRPNVRYELVDLAERQPTAPGDFAYSIDVLHHIRQLESFLGGLREALRPGARWLAIEPNIFHPYIYWSQERMRRAGFDEDHFRPSAMEPALRRAGFGVVGRRYAFLFPGWLEHVPRGIAWVEPLLERVRFLGGSVVLELERR